MKISFNWLKEYINTDLDANTVSEILTDIGLDVVFFLRQQISQRLLISSRIFGQSCARGWVSPRVRDISEPSWR